MAGVYRIYPKKKKVSLNNWSMTLILILINVICFVVFTALLALGKVPLDFIAIKPLNIFQGKYLWTFLTSMFMHGGFFHLFVNMFVLFSLGGMMERIIGKKRFLWFYLLSGLVAGLVFVLLSGFFGNTEIGSRIFGSSLIPAVGASGAIFAIAGLFMVLTPKLRFSIIFFPFFSLPAYVMIPLVLFVTWIISSSANIGIGNTAHFGGFLCGLIYGLYLRKKYPRKTKMLSNHFAR